MDISPFDIDTAVSRSPDIALAVEAERRRCLALLDMSMPGYEGIVRDAIERGEAVGAVATRLMAEMKSRGPMAQLDALRADATPTVPFATAADPQPAGAWDATVEQAKRERGGEL